MNRLAIAASAAMLSVALAGPALAAAGRTPVSRPTAANAEPFHLSLPAPTGDAPVGVRSDWVIDRTEIDPATSQSRALPIRVWYPARHGAAGAHAPYVSASIEAATEGSLGLPDGLFAIDTHAIADARPRPSIRGVVLATPGWGLPAATLTGVVIDLASRGYVVVTVDHPHDALLLEAPDGTFIFNTRNATESFDAQVPDLQLALDDLPRLVPWARPGTPIGVIGHSIGGAAAAETMLVDDRITAGINLDGSSRGAVVTTGLDRPFGMMLDREHDLEVVEGTKEFLSNLRGPHPVQRLDILHLGFTDFVVFNPEATAVDPLSGAILEHEDPTGTADDLAAGRTALAAQRAFIGAFMDCYLVHRPVATNHCTVPVTP
jgi:predicted dienelactone hydrolase